MLKLGAKKLLLSKGDPEVYKKLKKSPIYIVVDNVLDTYNIWVHAINACSAGPASKSVR